MPSLAVLLNAVSSVQAAVPVAPGIDGLVAAYAFDADASDSSGNGYDATLLGDATVQDSV